MKKLTSVLGIFVLLLLSFVLGIKWSEFLYDDICLDMGGGKNQDGYEICVIEKLVTEKIKVIKDEPVEEVIDIPLSSPSVVCTMDAKQCPDGSYIGRTGPNCEFGTCPVE